MTRAHAQRTTILIVIALAALLGGVLVMATSRDSESRAATALTAPASVKVVESGASRASVPGLERVASIATLRRERAARKRRRATQVATPAPRPRSAATPAPDPAEPVSTPAPAAQPTPAPAAAKPAPAAKPTPRPTAKKESGTSFDSSGESFDSSG